MPTKPLPRVVLPRAPAPPSPATTPPTVKSSLRSTGKMPRYELELLLREATRETRETREREDDGAPPSSVVLPLVTRKPRTDARD